MKNLKTFLLTCVIMIPTSVVIFWSVQIVYCILYIYFSGIAEVPKSTIAFISGISALIQISFLLYYSDRVEDFVGKKMYGNGQ